MKVSDHTMTILTGLVLTVTVGMLAQNSEAIMAGLAGENILKVQDDAFSIRAGKPQALNVLLNDQAPKNSNAEAIMIVDKPPCGALDKKDGQIQFIDSETCVGEVQFTYCLTEDEACKIARVVLQVLPPVGNGIVVANAEEAEAVAAHLPDNLEVASTPTLPLPEPVAEPEPEAVVAALSDIGPSDIAQPIEMPEVAALAPLPEPSGTSAVNGLAEMPDVEIADNSDLRAAANAENDTVQSSSQPSLRTKDDLFQIEPVILANVATTPVATAMAQPLPAPTAPVLAANAATCSLDVQGSAATGGEIALSISAPCQPDTVVTIRQGDFQFAARTDAAGTFASTFPAFANNASVEVLLPDGITKTIDVSVPDAERFSRVALLWNGDVDLDLRASEYGARPGQPGYVWSGETSSYRQSRRTGGGYLQQFGTEGSFAKIYTLPVSKRQVSGIIDLSLHVADGTSACDETVELRVLRAIGGNSAASNLQFTLGTCGDNMNGYEVMNALGDLRVAAR